MFTIKYHLIDRQHTVITHSPYTESEVLRLRELLETSGPGVIVLKQVNNRDETVIPARNILYMQVIEQ